MTAEDQGKAAYPPCSYAHSRLTFRGPKRRLSERYCAVLGATETAGPAVARPYPELVEEATGTMMVNLGLAAGGLDAFAADPGIAELCAPAALTVVQLPGALNVSNRYWRVHPRRNDRVVEIRAPLRALYPEIDVAGIAFTRHLLSALAGAGPERLALLLAELRAAWTARLRELLDQIDSAVVLVRLAHANADAVKVGDGLGPEPLFVTPEMVAEVAAEARDIVNIAVRSADSARPGVPPHLMPGPKAHAAIAAELAPAVARRLG